MPRMWEALDPAAAEAKSRRSRQEAYTWARGSAGERERGRRRRQAVGADQEMCCLRSKPRAPEYSMVASSSKSQKGRVLGFTETSRLFDGAKACELSQRCSASCAPAHVTVNACVTTGGLSPSDPPGVTFSLLRPLRRCASRAAFRIHALQNRVLVVKERHRIFLLLRKKELI